MRSRPRFASDSASTAPHLHRTLIIAHLAHRAPIGAVQPLLFSVLRERSYLLYVCFVLRLRSWSCVHLPAWVPAIFWPGLGEWGGRHAAVGARAWLPPRHPFTRQLPGIPVSTSPGWQPGILSLRWRWPAAVGP